MIDKSVGAFIFFCVMLLLGAIVSSCFYEDDVRKSCEDKGGKYIILDDNPSICIRPDAIIQ